MTAPILIFPGIGNSGPEHWQTRWENSGPGFVRVAQRDWEQPVCAEWVAAFEQAVGRAGPRAVVVAHSLACLAVAHWAATPQASPLAAALLVAVPDPANDAFPAAATGFAAVPRRPLPFPSIVVASDDDPYGSPQHAAALARAWGSRLVNVGACGHINAASGLGDWPAGRALLHSLRGN